MTNRRPAVTAATALLLVLLSIGAASAADPTFYVYGAAGHSTADPGIVQSDVDAAVRAAGATNVSSMVNNTDFGYKILVGAMFNQNFGVEAGYASLGTATYNASFTGGSVKVDAKFDGFVIGLIGVAPANETVSVFAKLGVVDATVKDTVSATGSGRNAVGNVSDTSWKPNFGLGAMITVTSSAYLRLELERFKDVGNDSTTGTSNVDLISAGLLVKF